MDLTGIDWGKLFFALFKRSGEGWYHALGDLHRQKVLIRCGLGQKRGALVNEKRILSRGERAKNELEGGLGNGFGGEQMRT